MTQLSGETLQMPVRVHSPALSSVNDAAPGGAEMSFAEALGPDPTLVLFVRHFG